MLTAEEQTLIRETFSRGPAALIEAGYDEPAMQAFLGRADVADYFAALDAELEHADALEVRTRYMAKRSLSRMSGAAVAVLGRAMAGPRYLRMPDKDHKERDGSPVMTVVTNATGHPILRDPEITPVQLRAAEATLDYLGVSPGKVRPAMDVDLNISILYDRGKPKITIDSDPLHDREADRALSRERVRNVIAILAGEVPQLKDKLDESLGLKPARVKVIDAPKKTVRKKKKAKKKTRGSKKKKAR